MQTLHINSMKHTFITVTSLLFGLCSMLSPVAAKQYQVIPGTQVFINSINHTVAPTSSEASLMIQSQVSMAPLLGGFTNTRLFTTCSNVVTLDGWSGISINSVGIIGGFTGSITGGRSVIYQMSDFAIDPNNYTVVEGGVIFDSRGASSAVGNVDALQASQYACATVQSPYPSQGIGNGNVVYSPGNSAKGNISPTAIGDLWIYVGKNVPIGTEYSLSQLAITLGLVKADSNAVSIPLTEAGDTLRVIAPPCTINTSTSITFDTASVEGRKVSAPVSFQCGGINEETGLEAYLTALAISETLTPTELALKIEGNKPGGVVRGYAGYDIDNESANCSNTPNSLNFDRGLNTLLGSVTNSSKRLPLVWQLCLKGNETHGVATGSAILDISYK